MAKKNNGKAIDTTTTTTTTATTTAAAPKRFGMLVRSERANRGMAKRAARWAKRFVADKPISDAFVAVFAACEAAATALAALPDDYKFPARAKAAPRAARVRAVDLAVGDKVCFTDKAKAKDGEVFGADVVEATWTVARIGGGYIKLTGVPDIGWEPIVDAKLLARAQA